MHNSFYIIICLGFIIIYKYILPNFETDLIDFFGLDVLDSCVADKLAFLEFNFDFFEVLDFIPTKEGFLMLCVSELLNFCDRIVLDISVLNVVDFCNPVVPDFFDLCDIDVPDFLDLCD